MATRRSSGLEAWAAALGEAATRWSESTERFTADAMEVAHAPKFAIPRDARFFCIGSCFARNIEEHLIYQGVDVLSRRIVSPKVEWGQRANGFVNKFTTHSIRNEVEWVIDPPAFDASWFEERGDGWYDLQLSPKMPPVTLERAIERRTYITREYFARLHEADVVVLTLGLNEVWFDTATGRHLNGSPSFYAVRRTPDRYELHVTDVAENLAELECTQALLRRLNPAARIVATVSPVPMSQTFSGRDVAIANGYSKATLRVAAEQFAQAHDHVDYFPSFDLIAAMPGIDAYEADRLHVTDAWVGRMMRLFLRLYLGVDVEPPNFDERAYLAANPAVDDAVRRGELASGFTHWRAGQPTRAVAAA